MGEVRIRKINKLILQEIGKILSRQINFRTLSMITVKRVETTDDLLFANVWVSILPDDQQEAAMIELDQLVGEIQRLLNKKLSMRFVPWIRFKIDDSEQKAEHLQTLIRTTRIEDATQELADHEEADNAEPNKG